MCVRWHLWRDSVSCMCCLHGSPVRAPSPSCQGGMSTLVLSIGIEPLPGRRFHGFSYRKLLDFRLNGESGELVDLAVVDGPADTSFHYYGGEKFCARNSPFLSIPTVPRLVFDTRTRVFYELPEFRVALVRVGSYNDARQVTWFRIGNTGRDILVHWLWQLPNGHSNRSNKYIHHLICPLRCIQVSYRHTSVHTSS